MIGHGQLPVGSPIAHQEQRRLHILFERAGTFPQKIEVQRILVAALGGDVILLGRIGEELVGKIVRRRALIAISFPMIASAPPRDATGTSIGTSPPLP